MKRNVMLIIWFVVVSGWTIAFAQPEGEKSAFSHQRHVIGEEMECADCHDRAETSATGEDDLLPSNAVCLDCHDEGEVSDPTLFPRIVQYSHLFSHQTHLKSGQQCGTCHGKIREKTITTPYTLPDMVECMDCHQGKAVSMDCRTCHLPEENLLPTSHTPAFLHNHADIARLDAAVMSANKDCSLCHKTQFCQNCHEGDNLERFTHPLNYEFTHALESQGKEKECAACHTERQFCQDCHHEKRVLPHNHKAGWVNSIPNDGGRHRVEAANDLEACISCHEEDATQICQPCHGQ